MAYSRKHSNIIAVSCLAVAALLPLSSSAQRASALAPDSNYLKAAVMAARESSTVKQKKSGEQLLKEIQHRLQQRYGKTNPTLEAIMIKLLAATDITNAALLLSPSELKELKDLGVEISDLTALRNEIKDSEGIVPTDTSPTGGEAFKSSNNTASSQKPNKPTTDLKEKPINTNGGESFALKEGNNTYAPDSPMVNANGSSDSIQNPDSIQDAPMTGSRETNDNFNAPAYASGGIPNSQSDSSSNGSRTPTYRDPTSGRNLVAEGGTGNGQASGAAAQSARPGAGGHSGANTTPTANHATSSVSARPLASTTSSTSKPAASSYKPSADDLSAGGIESAKRQYRYFKPTLEALQKSGQLDTPLGQTVQGLVGKYEKILKQSDSNFDFVKLRSCERQCDNQPKEDSAVLKARMYSEFLIQGEVLGGFRDSKIIENARNQFQSNYLAKNKVPKDFPASPTELKAAMLSPHESDKNNYLNSIANYQALNEFQFPGCSKAPVFCRQELIVAKEISQTMSGAYKYCEISLKDPLAMVFEKMLNANNRAAGFGTGLRESSKSKKKAILPTSANMGQIPSFLKLSPFVNEGRKISAPEAVGSWQKYGSSLCNKIPDPFLAVKGALINKIDDLAKIQPSDNLPEIDSQPSTHTNEKKQP